jgi:hypothetical protein
MSVGDPEVERQRLAGIYAQMSDGELEKLIGESGELSDVARQALQAELARLGQKVEPEPTGTSFVELEHHPLVTVRWFRDLAEALLAKGWLEAEGIEAFLSNENIVRLDWFLSNLVGGVNLQVRKEYEQRALEVLDQSIPADFEDDSGGRFEQPRCPKCESLDVGLPGSNTGTAYATAFLGLPLPFQNPKWKCRACGAEWDDAESSEDQPA